MGKPFFEVFPSLQLDNSIHDIMEQTTVEKISATKSRNFLRIYLFSTRLILKDDIWSAENQIKKQLFPAADMTVKIYERFELSAQYTPQKLMDLYKDSILAELKEYSHVEYNAFRKADIAYPEENKVILTVEDNVLVRIREEELIRVLEKILVERCGFPVSVKVEYKEAVEKAGGSEQAAGVSVAAAPQSGAAAACTVQGSGSTASAKGDAKGSGSTHGKAVPSLGKGFQGKSEFKKGEGKNGEFKKEFKKGEFSRGGDYNRASVKRSDNPDVLYGRDFEEEAIKIEDIIGEMGEVVIRGKIIALDKREIKNEKTIIMFDVTDFTDTMTVKIFTRNDQVAEVLEGIKPGAFIKLKGISIVDKFDHELTIGSIAGIKKIPDFTTGRKDTAAHKRVELHCHTKMSDMDGVSEAKDIVKRAYKWGHRAIAITDHGVVQSFTDANHVWDDLWKTEKTKRKEEGQENPDKQDFFKILYGVEAYLVDDLKETVTGDKGQDLDADFVVFDIETTGFSPVNNRIIEIGAVKVSGGEIVDRYSAFVNPDVPIPFEIEKLTGINDEMVMGAPMIDVILPQFLEFCQGCVMVAHNASFDMSFIIENARRIGLNTEYTYVDTVAIARVLLPNQAKHTLDAVAKTLNVSLENHHRAVDDAEATAHIFVKFIPMLRENGAYTLAEVNELGASSVEATRRLPYYHAIILAKNDLGRINLYRLVSMSHLTYFNKQPKIPKSQIF